MRGRRDVGGRSDEARGDEARGDEVVGVAGKERVDAALTPAACANLFRRFVLLCSS